MNKQKTIDEIELEVLKSAENMNKTMGKIFLWVFIIVFGIMGVIMWLGFNHDKINLSENFYNYIYLILLGIIIIIGIVYFIQKSTKKNTMNRTNLIITTNKNSDELKNIMNTLINQLYYKEKKYYDEMVYYAYKSENNGANINSLPRYLKYKINGNNVEIETWFVKGNKEFSIDSSSYGLYIKETMLWDLKKINSALSNSSTGMPNE